MAFLAQNLSYVDSEEQFVMTSLHPGEAPDEVAFFLVMNTSFDHHDFTKLLVVQLGADWSTEQALTDGVRAHATVPDGEDDEDEDEEAWSGGAA